jgi:HKD family nuclease
MKVLATAGEISTELNRLIRTCSSCRIAVAWASTGFDAFDLVARHRDRIEQMIVGTQFYQTDPRFIEAFLDAPNVRFVLATDGVFHPKCYLFELSDDRWECIIGSPNFTRAAAQRNDEMAVLEKHRSRC